jgi:hypothetical protein
MYEQFWMKNLKRKGHLEKPRHRLEDNIKVILKKEGVTRVDWIQLAQDKVQWLLQTNEPLNSIDCREFLEQLSDYQLLYNSFP